MHVGVFMEESLSSRVLSSWHTFLACKTSHNDGHAELAQVIGDLSKTGLHKCALYFARNAGLPESDADDIYQESMLLLLRKCQDTGSASDIEHPGKWLAGTMRWVALGFSRKWQHSLPNIPLDPVVQPTVRSRQSQCHT
jgi:DNA-directed RNA polymerase specialized sigma24 family protein